MKIINLLKLAGKFNKCVKASFDDSVSFDDLADEVCMYSGKIKNSKTGEIGKVFEFGDEKVFEVIKYPNDNYKGYKIKIKDTPKGIKLEKIEVEVTPGMIEAINKEEERNLKKSVSKPLYEEIEDSEFTPL